LHRDEIGTGIEDDVLYRSSLSDRREQQANRLAADILMPGELLAEAREAAEEKGVGDVVLYLADMFAVSEAAMRIKVGQ
jgi:Zn-dependent peptidase ImmA (M78 family)